MKTIELIDKYIIKQNDDTEYNPPSYIWTDNTGEIVRCRDCKYAHLTYDGECKYCDKWTDKFGIPEELYLDGDFYCGYAKRREDG